MSENSSIYSPYRALGLVSDGCSVLGCQPSMHLRGTAHFLTTPVENGRSFHLYDMSLQLRGVSRPIPRIWTEACGDPFARISRLSCFANYTFIALGHSVGVYREMRPVTCWTQHTAPITRMALVANFLVTVAADEYRLLTWRIPTKRKAVTPVSGDVVADIILPPQFRATSIAHPPTYLNKILLGAEDGRMLLLNLRTRSIVHIFNGFASPITVLAPAPVIDVVAVGTRDGRIILHNIRADRTVSTLRHGPELAHDGEQHSLFDQAARDYPSSNAADCAQSGSINKGIAVLSFSSDGSEMIVSGDPAGNLAFWDLNEQALISVAKAVHPGGTSIAQFLIGEPLLVTAGTTDNSLKVHIFDGPTKTTRILRSRDGHRLPPTRVRFSGADAKLLVSAGLDREVRLVSVVRDAQNRSFAQSQLFKSSAQVRKRRRISAGIESNVQLQLSNGALRLPPVTALATNNARRRDNDFANVVTAHAKRTEVYTWRLENGAIFHHILRVPAPPAPLVLSSQRGKEEQKKDLATKVDRTKTGQHSENGKRRVEATSVAMSPCGNTAFIGYDCGELHSFNLQSGRHQGAYVVDESQRKSLAEPSRQLKTWGNAHSGPITGLALDACGDVMASCGGEDETLLFWNLRTREPSSKVLLPSGAMALVWSKSSDLVAVSCDDFGIYVYDASTAKLARRLLGHRGAITDITFDSEGRRLVSSSMDGSIRTWDLPSGLNIDVLLCENAPTSLAIAPGGEFIASCHVNSLSISLWVDTTRFSAASRFSKRAKCSSQGSSKRVELPGAYSHLDVEGSDDENVEHVNEDAGHYNEEEGVSPSLLAEEGVVPVHSLESGLVTLSGFPTTKWSTLANLAEIKQRNKPIQPPKRPEAAPFFIPTTVGALPKVDATSSSKEEVDKEQVASGKGKKAKKKMTAVAAPEEDEFFGNSKFGSLVIDEKFETARKLLKSLGPSGVDTELRMLEGEEARLGAIRYFVMQLTSRTDFELHQAHLDVFLRVHGQELVQDDGGQELLNELMDEQTRTWKDIQGSMDTVLTLAGYFTGLVQI